MGKWIILLLAIPAIAQQSAKPKLPDDDAVRIQEFYRLASAIQDGLWPGWGKVPAPLMLVTTDGEFLTHHPAPPKEMQKAGEDLYARPRQFPTGLEATFPAFGPPSVIVIGEPAHTASKTSTPWLFTVMHEHFHQLQDGQPDSYARADALGLSHGDTSGGWMLNYPFPYDKPEVSQAFRETRDLLLRAVKEPDGPAFQKLAAEYIAERRRFFAMLSSDDRKYLSFQLWKEGIARYTQVRAAESAAHYLPSAEFAALPDYEAFTVYAAGVRQSTLDELAKIDLPTDKRVVVYSFGATEGFLLDRIRPKWKDEYFQHMFTLDFGFEGAN